MYLSHLSIKIYNKKIMHYMKLNDKYYNLIKNGNKTIELRLYDDKRKLLKKMIKYNLKIE